VVWGPAVAQQVVLLSYNQSLLGVGDTAKCGIDPIPSKYRASIADTDTFYLEKQLIYFRVGESNG